MMIFENPPLSEKEELNKNASIGVWSVTVDECSTNALQVYPDPTISNKNHALIDFTSLPSKKVQEKVADKLAAAARKRGCLFHKNDHLQAALPATASPEHQKFAGPQL